MVRPTIDPSPYKDKIISLFQTGVSSSSIYNTLRDTYALTVIPILIRRRIEIYLLV